jgi:transcriptional regulator with XRE-family HTH domain
MQRFGEKVHTLRQQQGLSLRKVASALGLATHSHLDRIESGQAMPSADLILKIAEFFGVSIDQLMRDELEIDCPYLNKKESDFNHRAIFYFVLAGSGRRRGSRCGSGGRGLIIGWGRW